MVGGFVRAKHDVHGEGVGLRDLDPFFVTVIFFEGNKLKRGEGAGLVMIIMPWYLSKRAFRKRVISSLIGFG